ncbi:MAG: hypothetical protein IT480_18070 [Gammaproteobacteria bacterium]|nr:hypothetical protein [Gammaproteobacteria bacterium]
MARKGKRPAPKRKTGTALPADAILPDDPAREAFIRGLLARGEAARPGAGGRLPPGATHEIVGTSASGLPIVRRRRFA